MIAMTKVMTFAKLRLKNGIEFVMNKNPARFFGLGLWLRSLFGLEQKGQVRDLKTNDIAH
jgi:hypothetical protein